MKDLEYIVSLGFSGADVGQAVVIAFFLAMLMGKKVTAWQIGFIALFIDRVVWPISGQAIAGADIQTIYASIGAMIERFLDDIGVYAVRYIGLTIMIAAFVAARRRIHQMAPAKKAKPAAA
ncbi:MAG: hypothetical protein VX640_15390 [Pseudomonadota bacterium]|nr:hypothetical protein [Pseudomonadota bacterium]